MKLFVAGISYKTAPVSVRERLVVSPSKLVCHACRLKLCGDLDEVVLLSTCNRTEIYGTTSRVTGRIDALFRLLTVGTGQGRNLQIAGRADDFDFRPYVYVYEDEQAARHLFHVASGMESMVLGETEITGQVKLAYDHARQARLTGRILNQLFQKAFHTVKDVRTRTPLGRGATSVGSVAVQLAEKIFGDRLVAQTAIIIGAGRMGETCLRHLAKKGLQSLVVSNRSYDRAVDLAAAIGGRAIHFDDCLGAVHEADIVVTSTRCPRILLFQDQVATLMRARRNRPLFLIDISVPRNIDPAIQDLDNVYLYNIDDLRAIVKTNTTVRAQQLALGHTIIDQKLEGLMSKLNLAPDRLYDHGMPWQHGWVHHPTTVAGR